MKISQTFFRRAALASAFFGASTACLFIVSPALAEDDSDSLDSLPEAVRKAAEPLVKGAEIEEVEPTFEDGQQAYEVEFERDGVEMAIVLSPDGKLLLTEHRLSVGQTPETIAGAVERDHPGSKITSVKKVEKGSPKSEYYKVSLRTADGKVAKVKLDPAGAQLK